MSSPFLPEFDDVESAQAAQAALMGAQSQLDDAWLRWSVILLADMFAQRPLLQAIRFRVASSEFRPMIQAGLINPKGGREPLTFSDARAMSKLERVWSSELLAETAEADKLLAFRSEDARFAPLMRAATARISRHGCPEWLLGSPKLDAAALCKFLDRPDIQAALERKSIDASTPAGASSVPAARI